MKLSHYSEIPPVNGKLLKAEWLEDPRRSHFKPNGFWVSVDGDRDWAEWCQAESFGLDRYKFRQEVTLSGNHNVLHLETAQAVRDFAKAYPMKYRGDRYMSRYMARNAIDWAKVMRQFDGIIIAPYQYTLRMADNLLWYYSWDCASGCIWNPEVIANLSSPEATDWKARED